MKLKKWKISRFWRRIRIRRQYKDRLFQKVFEDKKDLLELYNAVNGTGYTNLEDLEITTLEDVIYLSMKNDLSFIISSTLNLYEHQSTYNPNLPVRGLIYFARLYEAYIKKNDYNVYGHKQIKLPTPQFIVFYNGRENQPDEQILKLSDAFEPELLSEPMLECKARMLNINYGHNEKLLKACKRLHDYSYFMKEVNGGLDKGYELDEAISMAMDDCIENGVLADILLKCKSEVFHMLLTEYDEKKHLKHVREEGRAEGREEGQIETLVRVNELTIRLAEQGRMDDIVKAAKDKHYQEQLFKEFGLSKDMTD